jgi:hypothetical protein
VEAAPVVVVLALAVPAFSSTVAVECWVSAAAATGEAEGGGAGGASAVVTEGAGADDGVDGVVEDSELAVPEAALDELPPLDSAPEGAVEVELEEDPPSSSA